MQAELHRYQTKIYTTCKSTSRPAKCLWVCNSIITLASTSHQSPHACMQILYKINLE